MSRSILGPATLLWRKIARVVRTEGMPGVVRRLRPNRLRATAVAVLNLDAYGPWIRRVERRNLPMRPQRRRSWAPAKSVGTDRLPHVLAVIVWGTDTIRSLGQSIASLRAQEHGTIDVAVVADPTAAQRLVPLPRSLRRKHDRLSVFATEPERVHEVLDSVLATSCAEWVLTMEPGDRIRKGALGEISEAARRFPEARLIYSDEDRVGLFGRRTDHHFKPAFDPDLLLSMNYIGKPLAIRRAALLQAGGLSAVGGHIDVYDAVLRLTSFVEDGMVVHVPIVLRHGRRSTCSAHETDFDKCVRVGAVRRHLDRLGQRAFVSCHESVPCANRVQFEVPSPAPKVSIVIPSRDQVALLRMCIDSVFETTDYPNYEIVIVDNGSQDGEALEYLDELKRRGVRVIQEDIPFNFSTLVNRGVRAATGALVCLLNNDIEAVHDGWLTEMVSHAARPGVGCVGARLLYPDGTLQHGGVVLGYGGVAGHAHKFLSAGSTGYHGRAALLQAFSAVTAACLLVPRATFLEAGGFDESLAVNFNDVDFCIRIREMGLRVVWTPFAELIHHESKSRGADVSPERRARFEREIQFMKARWSAWLERDPSYNPNLTLASEDFGLAWRSAGPVEARVSSVR